MEVNFFWRGERFSFLQFLVLKSHLKVGHVPVIWLSGKAPHSSYWKKIEHKIKIKNADDVYDVENFIKNGGNLITSSSLWRWYFLYEFGGIWCDFDVFALKKFPNDEWIVCTGEIEDNLLSVSILKVPPKQKIFKDCIEDIRKKWGNVRAFSKAYQENYGNTKSTHEAVLFYPYKWNECEKLISKGEIPDKAYSIHYWDKALVDKFSKTPQGFLSKLKNLGKPKKLTDLNEKWCKKNADTLLGKIYFWLKDD